jgi:hypothetical protein
VRFGNCETEAWSKVSEFCGGQDGEGYMMSMLPPKWVIDTFDGRPWLIFLDELTTCPPAMQAPMLRMLAEKYVGDTPLPRLVRFISAANPVGVAANGNPLEAPMANRVLHFPWEVDRDLTFAGWTRGLHRAPDGSLEWDFPSPDFPVLPEDWYEGVAQEMATLAAFHTRFPHHLELDIEDQRHREKASMAYPSMRSWTNAGIAMAAVRSCGGDKDDIHETVKAAVGEETAWEFTNWLAALDLPDPEAWLAEAQRCQTSGDALNLETEIPMRCDQQIVVTSAVCSAVARRNTKERWEAASMILKHLWDKGLKEIVVSYGSRLLQTYKPDYKLPSALLGEVYPLMQKAGMVKTK